MGKAAYFDRGLYARRIVQAWRPGAGQWKSDKTDRPAAWAGLSFPRSVATTLQGNDHIR